MSIEGPGLYQDDTGHDVRSEFRDLIGEGHAPDEATQLLIERWADVLGDKDVYCAFYLALADTQWRLGRLVPAVGLTALEIIDTGRDLRRWEYNPIFHRKRRKVLADLRRRLESPAPAPRAVRREAVFSTSLRLGDVIRYRTASGDAFLLAVVGVAQSNNQRIAVVRLLEGSGKTPSDLRLIPHAQPLALFPHRGTDFPSKRAEHMLQDWPVPAADQQDSLIGCSLVSWGVNLDPQLMRYRRN
jgi:hypothetical protein